MRKTLCTALALGVMSSTSLMPAAFADVSAGTLPQLHQGGAVNGSVSTPGSDHKMDVTVGEVGKGQQGLVGSFTWDSFNVGSDAQVNFEFTGHNQTAFNKVVGPDVSQIYGKLTSSGCQNCGYEATSKVILLNPNGVMFGKGANVNLNSFTVSTLDGEYKDNNLTLHRTPGSDARGIVIDDGAVLKGSKGLTFASDNVVIYKGSKLSTDITNNDNGAAYGKIKIVTADGVNFGYYNNGAVKEVKNVKASNDKMVVSVEGGSTLESGHIDIRNASNHKDSVLSIKGATLKATKAAKGNDGNIWLTSNNDILVEKANLQTAKNSDVTGLGGEVRMTAGHKISVSDTKLTAAGNVVATSKNYDVVLDASNVTADGDVTVTAKNIAAIQKKEGQNPTSTVTAKGKVTVNGKTRGQILDSTVNGEKGVDLVSDNYAWTRSASIQSKENVNITSGKDLLMQSTAIVTPKDINIKTANDITTSNFTGNVLMTYDGEDKPGDGNINVESTNGNILLEHLGSFHPNNTKVPGGKGQLTLKAAKNVELNTTDSDLKDNGHKVVIEAGDNIHITSTSTNALNVKDNITYKTGDKIYIEGKGDVTVNGNMNGIQTNLKAGQNLNANITGVNSKDKGLVAEAGNDMTINTNNTDLSVSKLVSGHDMNLKTGTGKVLSGSPKTTEYLEQAGDSNDRALIKVGGTFTSSQQYNVSKSGDISDDGQVNHKHHIEYGDNKDEKILLVNDRPVDNKVTDPNIDDPNNAGNVKPEEPGQVPAGPAPTDPSQGQGTDTPDPGHGGETDPGTTPGGQGGGDGGDDGECTDPSNPDKDNPDQEDNPDTVSVNNINLRSVMNNSIASFTASDNYKEF